MRQGGAHIAKRRREGNPFGGPREGICGSPAPLDLETHHVEGLPLEKLLRQRMVRVIRAAGIEHALDARQPCQMVGQPDRRGLRPLVAQIEGQHPALAEPAVERAGRHARGHGENPEPVVERLVARRNIAQHHIGMPRKQFGDRMDDDVRSSRERLEGTRRGECIVNDQQHVLLFRQRHQTVDIGKAQRGVRDHLYEDHPRFGADRRAHRRHVARIDHRGSDPEARQVFVHHAQRTPVKLVTADDVIARPCEPEQHRGHRRHPGGGHDPRMRRRLEPVEALCRSHRHSDVLRANRYSPAARPHIAGQACRACRRHRRPRG